MALWKLAVASTSAKIVRSVFIANAITSPTTSARRPQQVDERGAFERKRLGLLPIFAGTRPTVGSNPDSEFVSNSIT